MTGSTTHVIYFISLHGGHSAAVCHTLLDLVICIYLLQIRGPESIGVRWCNNRL